MILFLQASLMIWTLVTLLWIWSILIKNVSIVDIFWGFGFVIVNAFYFYNLEEPYLKNWLILFLVSVWGLRLTLYLAIRNIGKGEDYRYQQFRKDYGAERYWWLSYFQVFLLQGGLILIISLPLLAVQTSSISEGLHWLDYIAILVWVIGFSFEAGGDYQLYKFKKNKNNNGKVLNTGFWKYTRHPNYFGDATVWWAFALFSVISGGYWQIIGSVIMTLLIIKVSGVAMLEKTLKYSKPKYAAYIEKTNAFIPWFPKK